MSIPKSLRQKLADVSRCQCGYCQTQEKISGIRLTVEHIQAKSRGGSDEENNLWLSCRLCNEAKGILMEAIDPQTGNNALLFNPRFQTWSEHFRWSEDGTQILGQTAIGRATINGLSLNSEFRLHARAIWVNAGWHPPQE